MSRFGASKFRNAIPAIPPREEWYRSTLPSGGTSTNLQTSTFSSEVKANHLYIVTVTPSGGVTWRGYGKAASEDAKSGTVGAGTVGDWDLSQVGGGSVVVGGADGSISSFTIANNEPRLASQTPTSGSAITTLACHPTTADIVLAASGSSISIWDLSTSGTAEASITLSLSEPKGIWSASWSPDGSQVAAIGKSGTLYTFSPRSSTSPTASRAIPIQPLKPARVSWIGTDVFVTSTSRTRNREYHLFSPSSGLSTIFTATLDTSTTSLLSVIDQERKIAYLAARGDMTVRQVEIGGATGYQETLHPLQQAITAQGLALASPTRLRVMEAEIGQVLVPITDKDGEAILPLGIKVPRRQLIDFHADLYPDISGVVPEQTAAEWLKGDDKAPLPMSLDPARRNMMDKQLESCSSGLTSPEAPTDRFAAALSSVATDGASFDAASTDLGGKSSEATREGPQADEQTHAPAAPAEVAQVSTADTAVGQVSGHTSAPGQGEPTGAGSQAVTTKAEVIDGAAGTISKDSPSSSGPSASMSKEAESDQAAAAAAQTGPVRNRAPTVATGNKSSQSTPASTSRAPYNPNYSRKFLSGKAPLNPAYDSLPPISTLHPDSLLLHFSEHLLFFPVQGPGGRLGVHPLSKKGRMVTGGEGYLTSGSEIVCYAVDPFTGQNGAGDSRVAVACEDDVIRVWTVGKEGISGAGPDPATVIKESGIDKIVHMAFHPTAAGILVVLSNDAGAAKLRFFDLTAPHQSEQVLVIGLPCKGAYSFAFNALGTQVAISAKDGAIFAFDPRKAVTDPSAIITGKGHDSPRSFQLVWIDDSTLASVGFDRGSQRKINLYSLDSSSITKVHSMLIDVSPSVLFPTYDADTRILYVWGKGERVISAYEVLPEGPADRLYKLPPFTTSTGEAQLGVAFYPKAKVDVKKVEVMRALRLTGKLIEEVSFTIPRNKPEYFQDDIFVDTLDTSTPLLTAQAWLRGETPRERRISLLPVGMKLLSEAPKAHTANKAKFVPAKDVMTEQQKKQKEMDELFAKAKMGDSSDEDDEPKRSGIDPPDDDW